jgi:hypothetical protein
MDFYNALRDLEDCPDRFKKWSYLEERTKEKEKHELVAT